MSNATHSSTRRKRNAVIALLTALATLALAAPASATAPDFLWRAPADSVTSGSGAGQLDNPRGMVADPNTGHLYVAEFGNSRISEFTAWGTFVKAWGWDVAPEGAPGDTPSDRLEACTTSCKAGIQGTGAGQIHSPFGGVTRDAAGNLYVREIHFAIENDRVQKFSPSGQFLLMWGGGVVIGGATGTGTVTSGATSVTSVLTTAKAFEVGQTITGTGIEPGTTIAALSPGTITLSQPAGPAATGATTNLTVAEGTGNVPVNEKQTVTLGANTTGGTFTLTFNTPNPSNSSATTAAIPATATAAEVEDALKELANIGTGNLEVSGAAGGPWTVEFKGPRFADTDVTQLSSDPAELTVGSGAKTATVATVEKGASAGEVCGVAAECKSGVAGLNNGNGQFSQSSGGSYITYNPVTDSIFVGDKDRIQEFSTAGAFLGDIDFEAPALGAFDGKSIKALAADPASGDLYLAFPDPGSAFGQEDPNVFRLDLGSGEVVDELAVKAPESLAVDIDGNVFVVEADGAGEIQNSRYEVLGFDASGAPIEGMAAGDEFAEPPPFSSTIFVRSLATNVAGPGSDAPGNLYVDYSNSSSGSYVNAYGPPPIDFEPPPLRAPTIGDQYATSVDTDGALVKATINPRFWGDTRYRVQYATKACIEAEGWEAACVSEEPAAPGTLLTAKSVNSLLATPGVFLGGLEPDTTYRYRFAARSTGSAGEDVFGSGGTLLADGADATFTTFPLADPLSTACANQAFRIGPGAKLPDCRGYELVSPLDKNNGDIRTKAGRGFYQSALSGGRFIYSAATPFGEGSVGTYISQYLAEREPSGWQTDSISPPRTRTISDAIGRKFDTEYKLFSADLCSGWLRPSFDPPLTADAVPGQFNLYRRDNCEPGLGDYEALTTVPPPAMDSGGYGGLEIQGVSADGTKAIFAAQDSLTEGTSPVDPACVPAGKCPFQLYLHSAGEPLRSLCVQPNGNPFAPELGSGTFQSCFAGTAQLFQFGEGNYGSFQNALSQDGDRAYFTVRTGTEAPQGPGRIYLRLIGEEETLRVSQTISGDKAFFWGAANDGSAALFEIDEAASALDNDLFRFDADTEDSELIAEDSLGVVGASEDLSHVYFISEQALAGSGQNSEGDEAVGGEPNLYLHVEGTGTRFIGTVSDEEIATGVSLAARLPINRRSRVTPDGLHAVFMSTAPLTGYDNTDVKRGVPAAEVFRYDAEANELRCVSCNRSGVRPVSGDLYDFEELRGFELGTVAAQIPGYASALYPSRVLADDGTRLFFESHEALVTRDTNGVQDVYEWEQAGTGDCEEADSTFNEGAGGCVELISSGESPQASYFRDASPNGKDVFFATLSSLLPQDYGLVDIYDARVGGGFPQPTEVPGCEGEACQGPITPPDDPTPASSAFEGAGNVNEKTKRPARKTSCPKGKHKVKAKGKARCVPKKAKKNSHKKKKANKNGRAGR